MKAAICYEFGQPLVVEEIDLDPPKAGEVQVCLAAVAICHSDVHTIRGDWEGWGTPPPVVVGHEAAGVVEEVGDGVTLCQPGDTAVVSLVRHCGRCFQCTTGAPDLCEGQFALASEHRLRNKRGQPLNQGIATGAFAESVVVDQSQVIPISKEMPQDRACLLACGVITGVGAVFNTAKVEPGSSVVVIGAGGVGLNTIQGAALAGAYPIVALDVLDSKLAAARAFGATQAFNSKEIDPRRTVKDLTSGRGADYAFVTIGNAGVASQALRLVRRGGSLVLVGMPGKDAMVNLPMGQFVYDGQRVIGSHMGSTRPRVDVPRLVDLYLGGRLKLDELITACYPLEKINEAIEVMERGEALRNVIIF
ncbi:MAG: Zn-dependent alcohol dehydrogenase [Chloroflexi bacterium]|nr:Zn-dependent alcohol dehydrogenase [Chloroflexota bacterium]